MASEFHSGRYPGLDGGARIAPEALVLCLDDAFRAPVTGELRHRVQSLLRRGQPQIILNMARVSKIDAAGVGQLVRAYNVTAAANGVLRLVNVTRRVRELLARAGLVDVLSGIRARIPVTERDRAAGSRSHPARHARARINNSV